MDDKKRYKRGGVVFERTEKDYRRMVKRYISENASRFRRGSGGVWRQTTVSTGGEAAMMCAADLMCEPVLLLPMGGGCR